MICRGLAAALILGYATMAMAADGGYSVRVTIDSALPQGNVPIDPRLDLWAVIRASGGSGVLDPNSIAVLDATTGQSIPFARGEEFAYGDVGQIAWVVSDSRQRDYEVRFRSVERRPALQSQAVTPRIGNGDLLRYNAESPRPLELCAPARWVDLTGDGRADLVGAWNYAYRPGDPWNGIVCYPRSGRPNEVEFADLVRVRYVGREDSHDFRHFEQTYMEADFADFNRDGQVDVVYCPSTSDQLFFYFNSGRRVAGGMPVFVLAGQAPRQTTKWEHLRAVDLDGDAVLDITIGNLWLRGTELKNGLPSFAPIVSLEAGDARCYFDVDRDGRLDAITLEPAAGPGLSNFAVAWRRNRSGTPPEFDEPRKLADINEDVDHPVDVTAVSDGETVGLLVNQQHWEAMRYFQHPAAGEHFRAAGLVQSRSAVLGLGDQAYPCVCDWDADGDLDLLVGGGYGWPRIVINDGTNQQPKYRAAARIQSADGPIRLTRNEILGTNNWHDMGYSYPAFVDWDHDGLADLLLPNETNRIFWYKNVGTSTEPRFGPRQQIICEGFADSPEARKQSGLLADDPKTPRAPYPFEASQPFYWRTAPAFADFNGDGLVDFITADGQTRQGTLFVQTRDSQGGLRLQKQGALKLTDGRAIENTIVDGSVGWTESYRAADWDGDGLVDLVYSQAGMPSGGSIQLLRNAGTKEAPLFEPPRALRAWGQLINITAHGPHPWVGDLDGDGLADLLACVEWSVYPFFSHNAVELSERPQLTVVPDVAQTVKR